MIEVRGASLCVSGPMTIANARALREQGIAATTGEVKAVDLSAVEALDSSALAVLLAWQRAAHARGQRLVVISPPENLRSLANLYQLDELLGRPA